MLSRDLKIGIFGGIISSIIVLIFIQPILSFLWTIIILFGDAIQAGYVDQIYRWAALGDRNTASHLTFLLVLVFSQIGIISYFPGMLKVPRWIFKESIIALKIVVMFFSIIMLFALLTFFSISSGVVEIKASFEQRLTIMAPSLTDLEFKQIKAKWAMMKGQSDYLELVRSMDSRAKELKISLPAVRKP